MIRLIACGKVKEKWMREGCEEYLKRLGPYEKVSVTEVPDEKAPETKSDAENEIVKMKEGRSILKQIKDDEYVILLDLAGKQMSSEQLADTIQSLYNRSRSKITFVIGGSLGVSKELIQRADQRWQLSLNTFPHQLCRILVLEQIYRAFRILRNEPYHK